MVFDYCKLVIAELFMFNHSECNYIFFFDSLKFMRKEPVHKELKMLKLHTIDLKQVE